MKYQIALRQAEDLQVIVLDKKSKNDFTEIGKLHKKCRILINNTYPITHQFANTLDSLALNFDNDPDLSRMDKLDELLELIVDDLRLKSKMAVYPKNNLQEITELQTKIADLQKQKKDLVDEIIAHKDNEIQRKKTIDIKQEAINQLVSENDDLKKQLQNKGTTTVNTDVAATLTNYRISFFIVLLILLSFLNYSYPILMGIEFNLLLFIIIECVLLVPFAVVYIPKIPRPIGIALFAIAIATLLFVLTKQTGWEQQLITFGWTILGGIVISAIVYLARWNK
jgi:hypothetical protein